MFSSLFSLLYTKNPNLFYLKWVLIFALLIVLLLLYKNLKPPEDKKEGFTQKEPFVVKLDNNAIDSFYVELYDTLHGVDDRVNLELSHIIQTTNPDTKNSVFLDVGSVWGLDSRYGSIDDEHKIRASFGINLNWDSAIGPINFVLAEPFMSETTDTTDKFSFDIGYNF